MMLKSLVAAFAAAKLASGKVVYDSASELRTTTEDDYWAQWVDFVEREAMEFESFAHHAERFAIFKDNVDKINRHNASGKSWWMGITSFAHLTAEEFKDQVLGHGCTMERDPARAAPVLLDESNVADEIDWDAQGKVTPVKNQGQCGSCWAFSTTGAIESRYAIATGSLNELSEQELVDCSGDDGNNGCNGGLMDYGFKYVVDEHGLCAEDSYQYVGKTHKFYCNSERSACGAREDPIQGYQDVTPGSESQLMAAVSQGPVSVAIQANQEAFQLYNGGVFSDECGDQLDHGVLAVGYGTDPTEGDFWKVKNSWGANWGENGYIRLCRNCNMNEGKGQCGIAGQPSYPVV